MARPARARPQAHPSARRTGAARPGLSDATIRRIEAATGVVVDPHTADGLFVAAQHRQPGVPMVVLETALPIKFAGTIAEALGRQPARPARFDGIESLPKRFTVLPADVGAVQRLIEHAAG